MMYRDVFGNEVDGNGRPLGSPKTADAHNDFDFSDLEAFGSNSSDIGLSERGGVYSVSLKHKPTGKVGKVDLPASFGSWLYELRERLAFGAKTDGEEVSNG